MSVKDSGFSNKMAIAQAKSAIEKSIPDIKSGPRKTNEYLIKGIDRSLIKDNKE